MQNQGRNQNVVTSEPQMRLSIGKAAEYLGVSIDTLRRWEKKEKVKSTRSPGGHRYFTKEELDNVFGQKYKRDLPTKKPISADVKQGVKKDIKDDVIKMEPPVIKEDIKKEDIKEVEKKAKEIIDSYQPKTTRTELSPKIRQIPWTKVFLAALIFFVILDAILITIYLFST